jgi:hypothetical protein
MNKTFGWIIGIVAATALFLSISALVGSNQSAVVPAVQIPTLSQLLGAAGDIVTNVVNFTRGVKLGDISQVWISKTLEAGSNQVVLYRNQTGRDQWVGYGDITVKSSDTASSTSKVYIIATTTSSVGVWADFGTIIVRKDSLINGALFATSTTASTTSSVQAAVNGRGNGSILVPDGSYLIGYLQQNIDTITGCRGAVGLCESATSTRRGFNPVFTVRLHY